MLKRIARSPQKTANIEYAGNPEYKGYEACPPGYAVSVVPGKRFTAIPFDFSNIAASGTSKKRYTLSTGFHFVALQINAYGVNHGSTTENMNFTVLIRDEFTSQDLTKDPVHAKCITGSGKRPYNMPYPYRFLGGTTITVEIKNLDSGNAIDVYFVLIGYEEPATA